MSLSVKKAELAEAGLETKSKNKFDAALEKIVSSDIIKKAYQHHKLSVETKRLNEEVSELNRDPYPVEYEYELFQYGKRLLLNTRFGPRPDKICIPGAKPKENPWGNFESNFYVVGSVDSKNRNIFLSGKKIIAVSRDELEKDNPKDTLFFRVVTPEGNTPDHKTGNTPKQGFVNRNLLTSLARGYEGEKGFRNSPSSENIKEPGFLYP